MSRTSIRARLILLARLAFAAALGVVTWLMLTPIPEGTPQPNDKVTHLIVFGLLALLGRAARIPWLPLVLGVAVYAVLTETLQATLTTTRMGDPRDAVADWVGLAIGSALAAAVERLTRQPA